MRRSKPTKTSPDRPEFNYNYVTIPCGSPRYLPQASSGEGFHRAPTRLQPAGFSMALHNIRLVLLPVLTKVFEKFFIFLKIFRARNRRHHSGTLAVRRRKCPGRVPLVQPGRHGRASGNEKTGCPRQTGIRFGLWHPLRESNSQLTLRRSTTPIIRRNPKASVIAENPRHYWIYRMVHVVSCVPRYSGSDWGFSYFSLASLARIK